MITIATVSGTACATVQPNSTTVRTPKTIAEITARLAELRHDGGLLMRASRRSWRICFASAFDLGPARAAAGLDGAGLRAAVLS